MSDPVIRLNAALEGRYAIDRELGEGGMATVYLADDLRHERKVALKVLKPELAAVVGAERFLAEIKTTAHLQHPHILALFDSGEADGFVFYVMPYVEGESLRQKLDREHQLPVEEAVRIATNVAEALDYAHRHGVIHRDIKPGNVLIHDGQPVISDFGIALAVGVAGGGRLTETGLSLGTPHYMSPEQATGDQNVGPPTDMYALGCVLYEMLVGEPPYTGSTAQAVLGKIIAGKLASATEQRASVPANVDAAIRKALEKLPADRFTSAHDFASALADPAFRHGEEVAEEVRAAASGPWNRLAVGFATTTVLLTLAAAWGWLKSPPPTQPDHATRSFIDLGDISLGVFDKIIVSPDGSRFAVAGTVDGQRSLYWRDAAEENFRVIPGTENAGTGAAFSPDGDWIVYATRAPNALLKVSLSGGAPTPVGTSGDVTPLNPHWGDDGTIVFGGPTGMYRVPDTGGEPVPLLEPGQEFRRPMLLPGGRAVIGHRPSGGIVLIDLETDSVRELMPGGLNPQYVETGHILYADASGGLWAVPFDANRREVLGGAVPIFDGLSVFQGLFARFSVSRNGTLVYGAGLGGGAGTGERLLIVDLEGNEESLV
ncbi:MAG: protein kinase, partial [Longimicrobiales bacterium]